MFVIYIVYIALLPFLWILYFLKNKNESGFFFLLFSVNISFWFLSFILSYSFIGNLELLLLFSKLAYYFSIVTLYSFLSFVILFPWNKWKLFTYKIMAILAIFMGLGFLYLFTPFILDSLYYLEWKEDWYEKTWVLYGGHLFFSLIFLPLLWFFSFRKFRYLSYINKTRLSYILLGMFLFTASCFLILLILPIFWYWILEKYIAIFFLPFIILTFYSINRYHFIDIRILFSRIISSLCSLLLAIFISSTIYKYISSFNERFSYYWDINTFHFIFSASIAIFVYIALHSFIEAHVFPHITHGNFSKNLSKIQDKIPFLSTIDSLNYTLWKDFKELLSIDNAFIHLDISAFSELSHFFEKNPKAIFIDDVVFIYENKFTFHKKNLSKELPKGISLAFPLFQEGFFVWIFFIGNRIFNEAFSSQEISIFKNFSYFLEGHLKYIEMYSQIHDLNLNLDKRVDEKTMEYNTLVQKQKEYISMISHELRSPITSSLFLVDSVSWMIQSWEDKEKVYKGINLLSSEISKTADFIKNLFSVEKYDIWKIQLFTVKVDLSAFLSREKEVFEKNYKQIEFYIEENLGFFDIDEVQFRQVISNLLQNALKFANKDTPKVELTAYKEKDIVCITIEDNGKGLVDIDISKIFDKYSSGKSSSSWLGLGLYLCKRIVELHHRSIYSSPSEKLWGAKFLIKIS